MKIFIPLFPKQEIYYWHILDTIDLICCDIFSGYMSSACERLQTIPSNNLDIIKITRPQKLVELFKTLIRHLSSRDKNKSQHIRRMYDILRSYNIREVNEAML